MCRTALIDKEIKVSDTMCLQVTLRKWELLVFLSKMKMMPSKLSALFVFISLVQPTNLLQDKQTRINHSNFLSKYNSHTRAQD